MRQATSVELQRCVRDFLDSVAVLPRWIDSLASGRPGRGHYEWGNWSEAMRSISMWVLGGPWRAIVADVRAAKLVPPISRFHKLKDEIIWEIVDQIYFRAERDRRSTAEEDTVRTRVRSVFSWQRRHDMKKNSLKWFLDFAFVLSAYSEFQAHLLFSDSSIPSNDPARLVPGLTPAEFGTQAIRMEREMIGHGFLPFYCKVDGLPNEQVLLARHSAAKFTVKLDPPKVDMDTDVRETRGMPREEKAVDFMTPWLQSITSVQHEDRWRALVSSFLEIESALTDCEKFKSEFCRSVVASVLLKLAEAENPEAGYVYDLAASTAVEQSLRELKVPLRSPFQKRRQVVSRQTLRGNLDEQIERRRRRWRRSSGESTSHTMRTSD